MVFGFHACVFGGTEQLTTKYFEIPCTATYSLRLIINLGGGYAKFEFTNQINKCFPFTYFFSILICGQKYMDSILRVACRGWIYF